ncbi:pyridine nucleotide-disulfide oxidoreductase [Clostridium sp. chh4-2]|uniref:FAD-dependent oxidoreductase n=1 Tax=Clostridium sp. chh4-2 TaxID=2067550 RepID=UPI000CCE0EA3|nr:FAD-dependent oxidoreductase [Clostridium sp. chh4-2]PNV59639.1 pyridine nucleotide-disulfide oxidoreductase [Clostridium sp. chh4-2]PNV61759.1 pyridine nucleotide-disulfide oxidoreductase [Clostridium sp. chh4-2]
MRVLIIGGVAAGTKAAAKLKREDRSAEVTILTKGSDISYAGCGLPYYVGNVIQRKDQLIVNTPESFSGLTGVTVLTGMEAVAVNREQKTVTAVSEKTQEKSVFAYDKLVIASGASPVKLPVEGVNLPGVYFMRTPDDAAALKEAVEAGKIKRAVVAGGGFIGLEIAENLAAQGVKVSVLEMADHILPGFDPEMAAYVERHLADKGIMAFTGTKLVGILGSGHVEKVQTGKRAMKADAVILSVGIRANTGFLEGTGIELMPDKTVKVDSRMRTNDPDIYALGDCACVSNMITGDAQWSPMGSSANIEGRLAARVIAGKEGSYAGVLGTAVCKLPELNVGRTGMTESQAAAAGYHPVSVVGVVDDKAHYYPDASFFIIKMTADQKTAKLLGIQVLGKGAADKIVDIAATAISLKADLYQLSNLDLAYAPPFSTAIHPFEHMVNILLNKMEGEFETITPSGYINGEADGYRIVDASLQPSIDGADYVNLSKVTGVMTEFGPDEKLLLVCAKGKRAYMLQNRLKYYGYTGTKVLEGGLTFNELK